MLFPQGGRCGYNGGDGATKEEADLKPGGRTGGIDVIQLPFEEVVLSIIRNAVEFGGLVATKPPTGTVRALANTLADIHEQVVGAGPEGQILDAIGVTPGVAFDAAKAAGRFMDLLLEGLASRHIREDPVWSVRRR